MTKAVDLPLLESLSRETHTPLKAVLDLYQHEHDLLALDARITNYLPLLAARRVRHKLLRSVPRTHTH